MIIIEVLLIIVSDLAFYLALMESIFNGIKRYVYDCSIRCQTAIQQCEILDT